LSFDDDFDDIFEDFDIFKLMRKSQSELEKMLKRISSGELKGTWEVKQIDEPNLKGYAIRGSFDTEESLQPLQPLEPIDPLRPSRRRPLPERPFEVPKTSLKETREPLVDIFEDNNGLRVYVELPGVEKDDIKLTFEEGCLKVKAKNFSKTIKLPTEHVNMDASSTQYKNGVLQITFQKRKRLHEEDAKNLRAV
jgi:HSP20 family molecular chaperone IbpA